MRSQFRDSRFSAPGFLGKFSGEGFSKSRRLVSLGSGISGKFGISGESGEGGLQRLRGSKVSGDSQLVSRLRDFRKIRRGVQ